MEERSGGLYRALGGAGGYEALQRLLGARRSRAWFARLLDARAGQRVLDIGCGAGSLLDDLGEGIDYVGYDHNPRYVEAAARRHGDRGRFVLATVGAAELPAEAFDRVVARGVLHHLDDDAAKRLVAQAHRCLRPGGLLVTFDGTRHPGQPWLARLFVAADRGRHVRVPAAYEALLRTQFSEVEAQLVTDLLRVPYSHCALRARKGAGR